MADVAEVGDSASIELLDIHDACAHQDNAQIDQNLTPKHALGSDSDTTNTGFPVEPFETPQKAPDPPPSHEKTQDPPKVRSPGLTLPESPAVASTGTPSLGNCMLKTRKAKPNGMSVEQRQKLLQAQRRVKSTIDAREAEAAVSVQSRPHPPAPPNDQVIEPGHGEQNIGFEQKEGSTVNEGEERIKRANKQAEGKDEIGCGAIDSEIKANAGGGSAESDEEAAIFHRIECEYMRKSDANELSMEEEIEFIRIRSAERDRLAKKKLDEERDQANLTGDAEEDQLFVPEERDDSSKKRGREDLELDRDNGEEDEEPANMNGTATRPRKRARKANVSRKGPKVPKKLEQASRDAGLEAVLGRGTKRKQNPQNSKPHAPKKARKPRNKPAIPTPESKKKPKTAAKNPTKRRQRASQEQNLTDVTSMWTSNVFKDAQGNADGPDQPTFKDKRKLHALKELIASVPQENRTIAIADTQYLTRVLKDFTGRQSIKPDGRDGWRVRGMKTSLKHYQAAGAAFMRRRETSSLQPRGGLQADQMGLGKTVMMLANIVNGRPPYGDEGPRTTLIVAPPALCDQWYAEIDKHCEKKGIGSVLRHYAGNRISTNNTLEDMQKYDVILTTYNEVMRSYPSFKPPKECRTEDEKEEWWKETFEEKRGFFHRIHFLRIVLDEAQAIKNHESKTSIACCGLMAEHYWAISGTPILNEIEELYPYFKFLRVPLTGTYNVFKKNFCGGNDPDKIDRLQCFLSQFMIRRTHVDKMFGAPLLKLPSASEKTHLCSFNDLERSVYEIVKDRFVQQIKAFSSAGVLAKKYSHVLTMILRLRQLTAHILMLQETIQDLLQREDIEKLAKLARQEVKHNTHRGAQIIALRKLLASVKAAAKNPMEPDGQTLEIEPVAESTADPLGQIIDPAEKLLANSTESQNVRSDSVVMSIEDTMVTAVNSPETTSLAIVDGTVCQNSTAGDLDNIEDSAEKAAQTISTEPGTRHDTISDPVAEIAADTGDSTEGDVRETTNRPGHDDLVVSNSAKAAVETADFTDQPAENSHTEPGDDLVPAEPVATPTINSTDFVETSTEETPVDSEFRSAESERVAETTAASKSSAAETDGYDAGGSHGLSYDFTKYLKPLAEGPKFEKRQKAQVCENCGKVPNTFWITSCSHFYCEPCLVSLQRTAAEQNCDHVKCVRCGDEFLHAEMYEGDEPQLSGSTGEGEDGSMKKKGRKGKEDGQPDWLKMNTPILPSAKTVAVKAQILNWLAENPKVKIIVYTQFLAMIQILQKICVAEKWAYCEYKGTMSFKARTAAIKKFSDDKNKRILLASLKCGGLGLNLTMASKVVMIDPWWNNAVEQQAFCRVFRIGQVEETTMTRFCVEGTIDEFMIRMQERKQKEIDEVMAEGGRMKRKLNVTELLELFGVAREEAGREPFIVSNDGNLLPPYRQDNNNDFTFRDSP